MSSSRVFVGHLPSDARSDDIRNFFAEFRDIREITMKSGYCFVEFSHPDDARDAVRNYEGRTLLGERIAVEYAKPIRRDREVGSSRGRRGYTLVVENCPDVSWQEAKDFFRQYGSVMFADVDHGRREATVEMAHRDDVDRVIRKLDKTEWRGEVIRLFEQRSSGGSRYRSRSRSPRRGYDRYERRRSRSRSPRSRSRSRTPPRRASRDEGSRRSPSPR